MLVHVIDKIPGIRFLSIHNVNNTLISTIFVGAYLETPENKRKEGSFMDPYLTDPVSHHHIN